MNQKLLRISENAAKKCVVSSSFLHDYFFRLCGSCNTSEVPLLVERSVYTVENRLHRLHRRTHRLPRRTQSLCSSNTTLSTIVVVLQLLKEPVGVVSVCGRARQGKSFILNQLGFSVTITYDNKALVIDGRKRILQSGSIHYPRATPEVWPDIIGKAKEGGLDVIETYVFWNYYEPVKGQSNRCQAYSYVIGYPDLTQTWTTNGPYQVRKEKLGDRISALQQMVAPFGKV
ncbi:hypothetical protein L6452_26876 [Arctium lappa]|uniref:Uncharacterized protein n=1 Tax=Arctium lappa TaxID=4217 RepID=A0ACB8ZVD6_ARCLA|nr:hypothetical protein L6452_26876 [Arctium lappa]